MCVFIVTSSSTGSFAISPLLRLAQPGQLVRENVPADALPGVDAGGLLLRPG